VPSVILTDCLVVLELALPIPVANCSILVFGAALGTSRAGVVLVAFASSSPTLARDAFTMAAADFPSRAWTGSAARPSNVTILAIALGLLLGGQCAQTPATADFSILASRAW